jgi:PEP-CTERM motif
MKFLTKALAAAALLGTASVASATVTTLTFEGVGNGNQVGNFYAGLGITFSPATLALVDADNGGNGNFANEPSPNTIMFFTDANDAILTYAAGFTTGFSFFYTSSTAASVTVWDDVGGTGNLLGSLNLTAQAFDNCGGDPSGDFCNWTAVGVSFNGTAKSINFAGTAGRTGFDNITFGTDTPTPGVPEPASWAMLIAGFGLTGAAMRRRRSTAVAA